MFESRSLGFLLIAGVLACSNQPGTTDAGTSKPEGNSGAIGAVCAQAADCELGLVCNDSTQLCAAACRTNADCPDQSCDVQTGQCVTVSIPDAGEPDAGAPPVDAGQPAPDAGPPPVDAGQPDAGPRDAGTEDAGSKDAGEVDAGSRDAGSKDAGSATAQYYCDTCKTDMDCGGTDDDAGISSNGNYCLQLQAGATIFFCGTACTTTADCPSGATCQEIGNTLPDGGFVSLGDNCLPTTACPISGTTDAGFVGSTDGGYPAAFPTPPQVIDLGGPVLSSPEFIPIFFSNDPMTSGSIAPQMAEFFKQVGASSYWTVTSEYGVGAGTAAATTVVAEAAPTSIDDSSFTSTLRTWLEAEIPKLPAVDSGRQPLYLINYPSGTTITSGAGTSCVDFGGYHSDLQLSDGTLVAYAVLPRCGAGADLTQLQTLTGYASHELAEGSTDPYPDFDPAWSQVDPTHFYFERLLGGGEVGDMCVFDPESYTQFSGLDFTVQRLWSNAAAKAGHDPCVPALTGEVFFNTVPIVSDVFNYTWDSTTVPVLGVNVAVGKSVTIPLAFYSDAPTTAWSVYAIDYNTYENATANINFAFEPASQSSQYGSGQNGSAVSLTISPVAEGPGGTDTFYLVVSQGSGANLVEHIWPGVINENQ